MLVGVAATVAAADQATKLLAVERLTPGLAEALAPGAPPEQARGALDRATLVDRLRAFHHHAEHPCRGRPEACPAVEVVPGFWRHRYVENPGAAWGLLANASERVRAPFFLAVSLVAVAFIVGYVRRLDDTQRLLTLALSLVLGGAIGNLLDRLHRAYVIDFIDWYVGDAHWPTFNLADAAITAGVALMFIDGLRERRTSAARGAED